jgi:hypothetical protein
MLVLLSYLSRTEFFCITCLLFTISFVDRRTQGQTAKGTICQIFSLIVWKRSHSFMNSSAKIKSRKINLFSSFQIPFHSSPCFYYTSYRTPRSNVWQSCFVFRGTLIQTRRQDILTDAFHCFPESYKQNWGFGLKFGHKRFFTSFPIC